MTATHIVRAFDKVALRLLHTMIVVGLVGVAFGAVVQSIQA
jgi:hypothetical protein